MTWRDAIDLVALHLLWHYRRGISCSEALAYRHALGNARSAGWLVDGGEVVVHGRLCERWPS